MDSSAEDYCAGRIWSHDWRGLADAQPCDPQSWAGSVQSSLRETGEAPELWQPGGALPAFPFCAVIMLVKNEADVIGLNLRWLHRMGVRRFMVMNNASTDNTLEQLEKFQAEHGDADVRLLHDPVVAYLQAVKTTWMYNRARALWPELRWVLPIDSDEFLIVRHGLQSLAYIPDHIQALTIQKATHFYPFGTVLEHGPLRLDLMCLRSDIYICPPKIILRAADDLAIASGNHRAIHTGGGSVTYAGGFRYGFYYREFPTRSFAQFLSKVRNGGAAVIAANADGHDVGAQHWLEWYKILCERGEVALRSTYYKVAYKERTQGFVDDPFRA